ncbi:hypothetical protein [Flavobacterium geliluteum]|uniref:Uncharacterized protein n=1 Tax=Flavobacterium geliluteum TaxID=2816120 RepID=A0A941AXY8_9FLAO|nr:hypothetical protein [Flavobacterium geliluteum]MBP4138686.1 hypothetical protein [Flavobacterium geliluteum]
MTNIFEKIYKIHFYVLGFILLNFTIQLIIGFSLNSNVIFILKILIYFSGFALFFKYRKPFRKISIYFFYYLLSGLIIIMFWLFGGIFLAILSSIILFPVYPKEIKYEKDNLKVYSKFKGFLGSCCSYEIAESKLFVFEKYCGDIKLDVGDINAKGTSLKIVNDSIEYKHVIIDYKDNKREMDTIEKIKIE